MKLLINAERFELDMNTKNRLPAAICFAVLFTVSAQCSVEGQSRCEIVVEPSAEIVLGDELRIRATDLTPGKMIQLRCEMRDEQGALWRSKADFLVPESGVVDPSEMAPVSGTFSGVDPTGLFWSMSRTNLPKEKPQDPASKSDIELSLISDGITIAMKRVVRWVLKPDIKRAELDEFGFAGESFFPPSDRYLPGIVLLGPELSLEARVLASKGYATLSLQYPGKQSLTELTEGLPLEYFQNAIAWLISRQEVDKDRIALIGAAKGAELALLLGSIFSEIKSVVAYAPSSTVYKLCPGQNPGPSPWNFAGKEVPFMPLRYPSSYIGWSQSMHGNIYTSWVNTRDRKRLADAAIAVERSNGPILLISGKKDEAKPSAKMAEKVIERLNMHSFPFKREHLSFDDAGHLFNGPGGLPGYGSDSHGGTVRGNSLARYQSWLHVLGFLKESLRVP